MNVVEVSGFDAVDDPVKTEALICQGLMADRDEIDTTFHYVKMPVAWTINTRGLRKAQKAIDRVHRKMAGKKLFYVCQHILVGKLDFHEALVFSPHSTVADEVVTIPHHSVSYVQTDAVCQKKKLFGFRGAAYTHEVRRRMCELFPEHCTDTKEWHFYRDGEMRQEQLAAYNELLSKTMFALCPRGTGISTVRLFEALAFGCVPVVVADGYQPPNTKGRKWREFAIDIPEGRVEMIPAICESHVPRCDRMSELAGTFWKDYCSEESLHRIIVEYIEGL